MKNTIDYLIKMINSVINGFPCDNPPENVKYNTLAALATMHSVENLVYYCIKNNNLEFPEKAMTQIKKGYEFHSWQYVSNCGELQYLEKLYDDNGIEYMLLKGSIIRELYPEPDMRTSCDVDLLCHRKDTEKIEKLMIKSGFDYTNFADGVDSYKKEPFVSFEIHKELVNGRYGLDCLEDVWERSVPLENTKCGKKMCLEDFYIYMIVHIAKHFLSGGSGIRPIIDLYFFRKEYKDNVDYAYTESRLKLSRLGRLNHELCILSDYWFAGGKKGELTDKLSDFIMGSGTFGNLQNAATQSEVYKRNDAKVTEKQNKFLVVFMPYKNMSLKYPSLKKCPVLLPVYWVIRAVDVLLHKRDKIGKESRVKSQITENEISEMERFIKELEII